MQDIFYMTLQMCHDPQVENHSILLLILIQVMISVLVKVSIPARNIMTKKQVGKEKVYSAYTSTLLFITKESQD